MFVCMFVCLLGNLTRNDTIIIILQNHSLNNILILLLQYYSQNTQSDTQTHTHHTSIVTNIIGTFINLTSNVTNRLIIYQLKLLLINPLIILLRKISLNNITLLILICQVCLFVCLSVCLFVSLSDSLFVCQFVFCLSDCQFFV